MRDWFGEMIDAWLFKMLKGFIESTLDTLGDFFKKTVTDVQTVVMETPEEFSPELVDVLRDVSDTVMVPIAGLLLTYSFAYQIFTMVTEKNKGGSFDTGELLFLIIKVSCSILLITNAYTIALAFMDLGKWAVEQIPSYTMNLPTEIWDNILDGLSVENITETMLIALFAVVAAVVTFAMNIIVYLVAWSRIITILIYVTAAPIPMATLMNGNDWTSQMGQNYIKGLLALMLQGFFMVICLLIYAGILTKVSRMAYDSPIYSMSLFLIAMGILVLMLTRTHSLAKSIVGAS